MGELDGSTTWKSDINRGDTPRLVLTLAIKGRYNRAFEEFETFVKNV